MIVLSNTVRLAYDSDTVLSFVRLWNPASF